MKSLIKVSTTEGLVSINADVYNGLAIHRFYIGNGEVSKGKSCFVITHINTGSRITPISFSKKAAIEVVNKLNSLYDWNILKGVKDAEKVPQEVKDYLFNIK